MSDDVVVFRRGWGLGGGVLYAALLDGRELYRTLPGVSAGTVRQECAEWCRKHDQPLSWGDRRAVEREIIQWVSQQGEEEE